MKTLELRYLLLVVFFVNLASASPSHCPLSMCSNSSFIIRFPFCLIDQQPKNCSYPGFSLSCDHQGLTVLTLPHAGKFLVRDINYTEQHLHVYDPEDCLSSRLLSFNLSDSAFSVDSEVNFTFLSCPGWTAQSPLATTIECLGNSSRSVTATASASLAEEMTKKCKTITTVGLPASLVHHNGSSLKLGSDIQLKWDTPNCRVCEQNGAICGIVNNAGQQIGCLDGPTPASTGEGRRSGNGVQIFKVIALSIALPAIMCAIGIGLFLCRSRPIHHRNLSASIASTWIASMNG